MITPFVDDEENIEEQDEVIQPSKTYKLDLENGRLSTEKIDGVVAIKQFILKTLSTDRYKYQIYDDDVGNELESLTGGSHTKEYLESVIPELIKDCLTADDRIENVTDFEIQVDNGAVEVSFIAESVNGDEIREKVSFNV